MKIGSHVIAIVGLATFVVVTGCEKSSGSGGVASSSAIASTPAPTTPPAATTTAAGTVSAPSAQKITPSDKPALQALSFKQVEGKNEKGWPKFDVVNLSDKTVTFAALYGFAYDANNKLVARTATPLSWNGKIAPGDKSSWPVEVGRSEKTAVPSTATSFEICYDSIAFETDTKGSSDDKRCTDKRAKGAK